MKAIFLIDVEVKVFCIYVLVISLVQKVLDFRPEGGEAFENKVLKNLLRLFSV